MKWFNERKEEWVWICIVGEVGDNMEGNGGGKTEIRL